MKKIIIYQILRLMKNGKNYRMKQKENTNHHLKSF